jgi:hypothetical protein
MNINQDCLAKACVKAIHPSSWSPKIVVVVMWNDSLVTLLIPLLGFLPYGSDAHIKVSSLREANIMHGRLGFLNVRIGPRYSLLQTLTFWTDTPNHQLIPNPLAQPGRTRRLLSNRGLIAPLLPLSWSSTLD